MGSFIHTADTHLGYQQYHRPEREQDYLAAFQQVIDAAITKDVDAVVHSGDFFHESRPSTATIRGAIEQLRRLKDSDIEFLAVVGNHEGTQSDQWVDIFNELGLGVHLTDSPYTVEDTAFYGMDHVPPSKRTQLTYDFDPHDTDFAMLVVHGLFSPISPYGTWDIEHVLGSSPVAFNAMLLGDDHAPRTERIGETIVTYPGSTERTATDQTDPRGYNYITTDPATDTVSITHRELDTRPHIFIDASLNPGQGAEHIRRKLDQEPLENAIVAVTITGDGDDITPASLEEYGKTHGAFVVRVSDRRNYDPTDIDLDVSFADPDNAVQEQIQQMNLSVAAYDIERRVRDLEYPKSNLTADIQQEVAQRIDDDTNDFDQFAAPDSSETPQTPSLSIPATDSSNTEHPTESDTTGSSTTDSQEVSETDRPRTDQASFNDYGG